MNNRIPDTSPRHAAIIAGIGLLLMAIIAPFAEFFVMETLVVPGDAAATASNILADESLFHMGITAYIVVALLDVIVAWALYIFFAPANQNLSLLAAWFRIIYAAVFALAANHLFDALLFVNATETQSAIPADQLQVQAMLSLDAFRNGWDIGLVIFGLHLLVLGYVAFRSGYVPRLLGILLLVAGFGYAFDSFGVFLIPDFDLSIALFTFIGEVLLIFWLFIWGGRKQEKPRAA